MGSASPIDEARASFSSLCHKERHVTKRGDLAKSPSANRPIRRMRAPASQRRCVKPTRSDDGGASSWVAAAARSLWWRRSRFARIHGGSGWSGRGRVAVPAHRFAADNVRELGGRSGPVLALLEAIVGALLSASRSRANPVAENLVLRQQLAVLKVDRRPRLRPIDRAFLVVVSRVWSRWVDVLAISRDRAASRRSDQGSERTRAPRLPSCGRNWRNGRCRPCRFQRRRCVG